MDATADSKKTRSQSDQRFLPRQTPGRRESDERERVVLTEAEEARISLRGATMKYILLMAAVCVIGAVAVRSTNYALAPLLHDPERIEHAARVLASDRSYHTYDLNIETRQLRSDHIWRLPRKPELAVLGASHWQEGHASIAPGIDYYNAHVHRDYFEDILGVTEAFVASGKLPKKMIISIRDNQFLPVSERTDFLWVPGLPAYRRMAKRLGLPYHNAYANGLTPQLRQELSLPLLQNNIKRYLASPVKPYSSRKGDHPTLDTLLPDGSIRWSDIHDRAFTQARATREALDFAAAKRNTRLPVDPLGFKSVDTLLGFLVDRGVEVYIAHPPYNPIYWDAVQGSVYAESLKKIERVAQHLADKHGLKIIGSFNPADLGCTAEMYIDAEHSGPECLSRIIDQFKQLDAERHGARVTGG